MSVDLAMERALRSIGDEMAKAGVGNFTVGIVTPIIRREIEKLMREKSDARKGETK